MSSVFVWFVHGRTVPVTLTEFLHKVILPVVPVVLMVICIAVLRLHTSPLSPEATIGVLALEIVFLATYGLVIVLKRDDRAALRARAFRMDHAR
jgi:hypothetical protein